MHISSPSDLIGLFLLFSSTLRQVTIQFGKVERNWGFNELWVKLLTRVKNTGYPKPNPNPDPNPKPNPKPNPNTNPNDEKQLTDS